MNFWNKQKKKRMYAQVDERKSKRMDDYVYKWMDGCS